MTQLSVMELAKQGDPHAIAALINRSLASKGIKAEAELEGECIKISLQALQIPNQKAVITIIHRGMMILQVEQIKRVKVFTYRSDTNYLAWQYEIVLDSNFSQSLPTPQIAKSADLVQERTMSHQTISDQDRNLVSNPKGIILVKKLSQLQQNLQEYQDIIVRFTDEHIGSVRCLTTLTELIQVISKPSFLFAAVASNPNLRSLLDTIAESSKTDEHGDQVITNLSILQPGQQWQRAKIRLVTKIFLEPAQEQDNAEDKHQGLTLDLEETAPQPVVTFPDLEIPDLEIPEPEISQVNSEALEPNLDLDSSSESITSSSLFNDFSEPSYPIPQVVSVINDLTDNSNLSDSLFDEFMDVSSSNTYSETSIGETSNGEISNGEINNIKEDFSANQLVNLVDDEIKPIDGNSDLFDSFGFGEQSPNISSIKSETSNGETDNVNKDFSANKLVRQVGDETEPNDGDDDLFDNFGFGERSPDLNSMKSDTTDFESDINSIKSRIPKQNLDELLMLMAQEEQIKTELKIAENEDIAKDANQVKDVSQLNSDLGATTIERILGNMETISLKGAEPPIPSSDFVTLEDFSDDINSSGF